MVVIAAEAAAAMVAIPMVVMLMAREASMVLTYGKHRGSDIRDVPREYLEWLLNSSHETVAAIEAELERRDLAEMADASWVEKIIRTGFRTLALQHHPDRGGDGAQMRELLAAHERLKGILGEVGESGGAKKPAARARNAA